MKAGATAWALGLRAWLAPWWQLLQVGSQLLVLALSPASYRGVGVRALLTQLVRATAPALMGFTLGATLLSVVLIRIVVVTAQSYGLSQYALEMVVRVLVLELIPLAAALVVAVRYTVPGGTHLYKLRTRGGFAGLAAQGFDPMACLLVPRVLAGMYAVLTLAALSGALVLVLGYLMAHGVTLAAFESYTRTVGRVFSPVVTLIFVLKTLLSSLAVALVPVATALRDLPPQPQRASVELQSLLRMLGLLLGVEVLSLLGNYY